MNQNLLFPDAKKSPLYNPLLDEVTNSRCPCGFILKLHHKIGINEKTGLPRTIPQFIDPATRKEVHKCPRCNKKWDQDYFQRRADDFEPNWKSPYAPRD